VLQDRQRHHRDRAAEIQQPRRAGQDLPWVAQDIAGGACRAAGVGGHDRVIIDIGAPGFRRYRLRDLMGVVRRGNTSPDIQELADTCFPGQEAHDPRQAPGLAGLTRCTSSPASSRT